jgi:hypothetical protein
MTTLILTRPAHLLATLALLTLSGCAASHRSAEHNDSRPQPQPQATALAGEWIVDLRPTPDAPIATARMSLSMTPEGTLLGSFYGSPASTTVLNTHWGEPRFVLVTSDGGGEYITNGRLVTTNRIEGTTFAAHRSLLSVWTATRVLENE